MKSSTSSSGKAAPKYRAKGLKNRAGINAYAKSNAARKSDAGLANRAGISKPKPKVRAKGLKNREGINAYAKSTAARKSDAGLTNRGGIGAAKKTGAVMSKLQRNWDVKGMKASSKMGIYKDAITKANAIKDAKKRDAATAGRKPKPKKITMPRRTDVPFNGQISRKPRRVGSTGIVAKANKFRKAGM